MLKLRKILLCDVLFISILILSLLVTIIRIIIPKTSNYSEKSYTFTGIVTNIIKSDDKVVLSIKNSETIIATYYLKNNSKINVSLGDKIRITGLFKIPSTNTTSYLFNYKKYLKRKNIFYLVNISSYKIIKSNTNIYYYFKQKLINHLNNNPYLYTFILGEKNYLDNSVKRSYQENGISHLFAISGMHITLLVSLINKILNKTKITEERIFIVTTIILLIYLVLVGLSPSILRGVLFYILFEINKIYYFYIKPQNIFLIILSISLLINPFYIYDVGFQYSYLISFSLIMLSNYLKSNNYFISLFKVSIISFVVSIPITIYNFYQLNILGIIYNLFFVPLISIIIFPSSLLVIIVKPLEVIYDLLINILEKLSLSIANISIGKLIFIRLPLFIYIIYLFIIMTIIIKPSIKKILLLIIVLLIHYLIPYFNKNNYVQILDIGQGDSILIHLKNKNILLDTGGINSNNQNNQGNIFFNTTSPVLKSSGIKKINYLIISHGDYDHMGEAINLVENFKVEKVIFNCGSYNDLENELIKVLNKKKIPYYSCISELNIDDNKLFFLQTKEYDNENDNSNVIYTEINGHKFMFMGDAGVEKEKDILEKYNISNIDVLKVGHHGSKTSSSKDFIKKMNSKYSVISVGKNNRYGHPNKEVLNNLEDSKIYRTDQDGSIMFKIKNNKLKIVTCSP